MRFSDFIAPFPEERFLAEHYDRAPLHIPNAGGAGDARQQLLAWTRLNQIFAVAAQWREANVQVILNGKHLPPDMYVDDVNTSAGFVRRADVAKIHALLGMGASLVVDAVEDSSLELRRVTAMLSERFLGTSGANAYCSFRGIKAFHSHLDLHDVFAVHCEGEKVWRIYANRAPDPVEQYRSADEREHIDRTKGPVLMEVRMRPGDLLYIPRGYYHDALASSEASLHVTFSVARHTGRILFRLLEAMAMEDPDFRAWLPDGRVEDGALLAAKLDMLAGKAAALMRTPLYRHAVASEQLALAKPAPEIALSELPRLDFYTRTQRAAQVLVTAAGAVLAWQGGQAPLELLEEPARWLLGQSVASMQQLEAHYPQYGRPALEGLIALMTGQGLLAPWKPPTQ